MSILDLPHIGFVIAAYAIAAVVVTSLVAVIVRDHIVLRRALATREAVTPEQDGASA